MTPELSRRQLFGLAGAGAAAVGVGAVGVAAGRAASQDAVPTSSSYPFYGPHQAGITTPAQDRLHFASFDVTTSDREALVALLGRWTTAAASMTNGQDVGTYGAANGPYDAPPEDTGEAQGLPAAGLTVTIGFGPGLFTDTRGNDRFGIAAQRPPALVDLPHFPGDDLEPGRTGGDLCIQACAQDPQVAVHAIRNLTRMAFGVAELRWSQLGFGRTSSTSTAQATPRNLFGFKDGTANLKVEETNDVTTHVWVRPGDGPDWMTDGSYLVVRRIRMTIETWDRTSLREQEALTGRTKSSGAPLSGGGEFTAPDFALQGSDGEPVIAMNSHVRLSHPHQNDGARLLRRGYNFVDGNDSLGRLDAGLFFMAYQRDIRTHFLPIQQRLSRDDGLNEYLEHVGSAAFAVPPGVPEAGMYVGQRLFEG